MPHCEATPSREVVKDDADKAGTEVSNKDQLAAEISPDSETESETETQAAETVNRGSQPVGASSFAKALLYTDLLLSYCSAKAPDGIKHLQPFKALVEQQHSEESKKILELPPPFIFEEGECQSVDRPLEPVDD